MEGLDKYNSVQLEGISKMVAGATGLATAYAVENGVFVKSTLESALRIELANLGATADVVDMVVNETMGSWDTALNVTAARITGAEAPLNEVDCDDLVLSLVEDGWATNGPEAAFLLLEAVDQVSSRVRQGPDPWEEVLDSEAFMTVSTKIADLRAAYLEVRVTNWHEALILVKAISPSAVPPYPAREQDSERLWNAESLLDRAREAAEAAQTLLGEAKANIAAVRRSLWMHGRLRESEISLDDAKELIRRAMDLNKALNTTIAAVADSSSSVHLVGAATETVLAGLESARAHLEASLKSGHLIGLPEALSAAEAALDEPSARDARRAAARRSLHERIEALEAERAAREC